MNPLARAKEVFEAEIEGLTAVHHQLDHQFTQTVQLIVDTLTRRNKIVVVGIGKSGHVGRKIAATLTSTGSTSVLLHSVDALHGDLGVVSDGDVILALSYSGETDEVLHLVPAIKRFDVKIVSITGAPQSTLARYSDLLLNVKVPKEACPFNLAPTCSTTATLVMGDALAMAVLDARGFKMQDFAKHHPSGSIGRSLLLQVRDIMRQGRRNPVVTESVTVKEALLIMTQAKSGSVSVIDPSGRLAGVFTDGDLRRHMAADDSVLTCQLSTVMTRDPITIRQDALAMEALKIFNQSKIDDLIVIDDSGAPVGLIDSQDLPRLKLT